FRVPAEPLVRMTITVVVRVTITHLIQTLIQTCCQPDNMMRVTFVRFRLQVEVRCVMIDSSQQRDIVETENIMHYAIAHQKNDFVTVINEKKEKYSDIDSLINHVLSFDESAVFIRDDRMIRDENGE